MPVALLPHRDHELVHAYEAVPVNVHGFADADDLVQILIESSLARDHRLLAPRLGMLHGVFDKDPRQYVHDSESEEGDVKPKHCSGQPPQGLNDHIDIQPIHSPSCAHREAPDSTCGGAKVIPLRLQQRILQIYPRRKKIIGNLLHEVECEHIQDKAEQDHRPYQVRNRTDNGCHHDTELLQETRCPQYPQQLSDLQESQNAREADAEHKCQQPLRQGG
mmetsp:Transcript_57247/g.166107  ORF Transcript_57247/g.166107 Transcript_57247/m.166107 type:complete len:219 (+) Transcript_57247:206-862(+)